MTIPIIVGTKKPDEIDGTDIAELIVSGKGADVIHANGGDDLVKSGRGDDHVDGGDGDDLLVTGKGDDTADGGAGDDLIVGGRGDDDLTGGSGDDRLDGGRGDDDLTGGSGDDWLDGGRGWDVANFSGDARRFEFGFGSSHLTITDMVTGETDTVVDVEVLKFDNAAFFLDGRNNGPIADDVAATADEDGPAVTGHLLVESDAFDFDDDALGIVAVDSAAANVGHEIVLASGALLKVAADGTYSYDPNGQFEALNDGETATDSVSFTISDGSETVTRTLEFTIIGETDNLAPVARDVLYVVKEDSAGQTYQFDVTDENPGTLSYDSPGMETPPFSIIIPNQTTDFWNTLDGNFSLVPGQDLDVTAVNEVRDFVFTYTATDEFGLVSNQATATVRIIGENDAPQRPSGVSIPLRFDENSGTIIDAYNIVDPDSDNDVTDLDYTFDPPPGVVIFDNGDGTYTVDTDQGFDYLAPGQSTEVSFTATDRHGASTTFSNLTIDGVNDDPVTADDRFVTDENTAFAGDLFADNGNGIDSDVDDGDSFTVTAIDGVVVVGGSQVIQLASDALLTINPDGTFAYDPNGQFDDLGGSDSDSFVYTVTDLYGGIGQATATITVEGVGDIATEKSAPHLLLDA
ncbi:Ig-like domain-containing protein [Bauldia sp.]|uniref:Ig-like domain-containing protein n=1 Tax=Bauldia sp. TaxID=2575872 RepID=UPI003BAB79A8